MLAQFFQCGLQLRSVLPASVGAISPETFLEPPDLLIFFKLLVRIYWFRVTVQMEFAPIDSHKFIELALGQHAFKCFFDFAAVE